MDMKQTTPTRNRCNYFKNMGAITAILLSCTLLCSQPSRAAAFSSDLLGRRTALLPIFSEHRIVAGCNPHMTSSDQEDGATARNQNCHRPGRKRALLRKYSKALALSTTLIYGPMASAPLARRFIAGPTAQAASSTLTAPPSGGAYNFQDFKDVKKKISLAPGANVQVYEEISERVAVEGEEALGGMKAEALVIGATEKEGGSAAKGVGKGADKGKKMQKKQSETAQVSEWESDEFGFGEDDEDDLNNGVLTLQSSASSKPGKGQRGKSASSSSGEASKKEGDVVVTDRMAYNNYQAALGKDDHMKTIKKRAFYSIFPVFVITMMRGQIRAYREKKRVKRGLALFEQEKKDYIEEKKRKGKDDEGDDDDDDEDDDYDEDDEPRDKK